MPLRPWTITEVMRLCSLMVRLRPVDPGLAALVDRLINDDGVIPELHTALLARGDFDLADRLRRLMAGREQP